MTSSARVQPILTRTTKLCNRALWSLPSRFPYPPAPSTSAKRTTVEPSRPRELAHRHRAPQAFAPLAFAFCLKTFRTRSPPPEHLLEIVRVGHFDRVGVTLDLGHAHL